MQSKHIISKWGSLTAISVKPRLKRTPSGDPSLETCRCPKAGYRLSFDFAPKMLEMGQETARGLALVKPKDALDCWAAAFRRPRSQAHSFYSLDNRQEAENRVVEAAESLGARYALTGCSGAERHAPHIAYHRATAYVEPSQIERVARRAGLREVSRGSNVQIFDAYDSGVFLGRQQIGGIWIAHPVQLFIDLKQTRARGDEAAAFLHSQIIEPEWGDARDKALNR